MTSPFDYDPDNWNRSRDALIAVEKRLQDDPTPIEHEAYGFPLRLGAGVYPADPRLSHTANHIFDNLALDQAGKRILDLGTGTGALAIGVAYRGATDIIACDIEPKAVALAEFNRKANAAISNRIHNYESDLFDAIPQDVLEPGFDLIIANLMFPVRTPKFIEMSVKKRIPIYRRLLEQMGQYMLDDGVMLLTSSNAANLPPVFELFNELGVRPHTIITPHHNPHINVDMNWIIFAFDKTGNPARPGPY